MWLCFFQIYALNRPSQISKSLESAHFWIWRVWKAMGVATLPTIHVFWLNRKGVGSGWGDRTWPPSKWSLWQATVENKVVNIVEKFCEFVVDRRIATPATSSETMYVKSKASFQFSVRIWNPSAYDPSLQPPSCTSHACDSSFFSWVVWRGQPKGDLPSGLHGARWVSLKQ